MRRDATGPLTACMWVPVALCWETLLLSWQKWLAEVGTGRELSLLLCPSTLGTRANEQLMSPGYLPAPRAAPAPWQLRALCFLPSDHELLSLLPPPKSLAGFYPLQQRVLSPPHCTHSALRDQSGLRRVGLGAASKHMGHAWGVWRA